MMENSENTIQNFAHSIRKLILSNRRQDKLSVLLQVAHAFDLCDNEDEKSFLVRCLINIDFPTHLYRLVLPDVFILKLSMKIVLLLSENIELVKKYPSMLACHFRVLLTLAGSNIDDDVANTLKDGFTFFKIIEERLGVRNSFPFDEVCGASSELAKQCTTMLSTHFYKLGRPDPEMQDSIISLGRKFLFMNPKAMPVYLTPLLNTIFNADFSNDKNVASRRVLVTLMSVQIHDFFLNQSCDNVDIQLFYIIILRYFGTKTILHFPHFTLKIFGYFLKRGGYTILTNFIRDCLKCKWYFYLMHAILLLCEIVALLEISFMNSFDENEFQKAKKGYCVLFMSNQWSHLDKELSVLLKCGPVTMDTLRMWITLKYVKFKYSNKPEKNAFSLVVDIVSLIKSLAMKSCQLEVNFNVFMFQMLTVSMDLIPKDRLVKFEKDLSIAADYLKLNIPRDRLQTIISPKHLHTQYRILDLTDDELLHLLGVFTITNPPNPDELIIYPISFLKKLKTLPQSKTIEFNLMTLLSHVQFSGKQIRDLLNFLPKNLRHVESKDGFSITFLLNLIKGQIDHMNATQRQRTVQYLNWLIERNQRFTADMKVVIVDLTVKLQLMSIKDIGEAMDDDSDYFAIDDYDEMEEFSTWGTKEVCS